MNARILLFLACIGVSGVHAVELHVQSHTSKAIPLLLGSIDPAGSDELRELMAVAKRDFSFTGQFTVDTKQFKSIPRKKELLALHKDALFALFITAHGAHFEWRLYDTIQGSMIAGKRYKKRGDSVRGWAHNIADVVWKALTADEGFFSTKIAYCKEKRVNAVKVKHVYIADYDGSNEQLLVDTPTINVAPRWNNDSKNPLLFYSDFTNTNVRLKVTDLDKKSSVASDFDGLNMIPAFSRDGKKLVYCISRGDGSCQLYYYRRGVFKKITHNNGNNVSPTLSDDGKTVYFCSDFESGKPQIYACYLPKGRIERLTSGGYCASPRYSSRANKLAYSRIVKGVMQLFVYDLASKEHRQLTFDTGHKEECSWSPCGTKLLYCVERGNASQIAMMSLRSSESHLLTKAGEQCSFPDWSGIYEQFPQVKTTA